MSSCLSVLASDLDAHPQTPAWKISSNLAMHQVTQEITISNPSKQWAFLASSSSNLTVAHSGLYPNPSLAENTLALPNSVVRPCHKVKHLHLRS